MDFNTPNWEKMNNGLVPAIIQDARTKNVLMLGYMNAEALEKTQETGKVTFFSRSKQRLSTKGEESGNFLNLVTIKNDCDNDSLLISVHPVRAHLSQRNRYLLGGRKQFQLRILF